MRQSGLRKELVPMLCVGMQIPELCSGKQACSTGNATASVPTWAKHANAEIPVCTGMTRFIGFSVVQHKRSANNMLSAVSKTPFLNRRLR